MLEGELLRDRVKVHLRAGAECSLFNTGEGYRLPHIQQRFTVLMGHALFSSVRASAIMPLHVGTEQPILPSLGPNPTLVSPTAKSPFVAVTSTSAK
jgi:hypothetical protein